MHACMQVPSITANSFLRNNNNNSNLDARVLDRRIKAAWAPHPQHLVIDNATDFAGKLARANEAILAAARAFFGEAGTAPGTGVEHGEGGGGGGGKQENGAGAAVGSGSGNAGGGGRQHGQRAMGAAAAAGRA